MRRAATASSILWCLLIGGLAGCDEDSGEDVEVVDVRVDETAPSAPIEELPNIDTSVLSESEKRSWVRLINDVLSPCGEPISVARCVSEERDCAACVPAATYVGRLVAEGYDRTEIREHYRNRYDEDRAHEIDVEGAPVRGALMGADVTIVEFSDFECPFCRQAHPILSSVAREHSARVAFVFKHYPLSMHEHARAAARAAVAAQNQGKFWEMHDMLFENQHALEPSDLESYAERIGLDMERFRADMEAEETEAVIERNRAQGRELGVDGTPRVFVDGRPFEEPVEALDAYIREKLAAIDATR
jgi:protein-disulfide isomerase